MFKRIPLDDLVPFLKEGILYGSIVLFVFICWKAFRMRKKDSDRLAAMPLDDTDSKKKTKMPDDTDSSL